MIRQRHNDQSDLGKRSVGKHQSLWDSSWTLPYREGGIRLTMDPVKRKGVACCVLIVVVLLVGFVIGFLSGFLSQTRGQTLEEGQAGSGPCLEGVPEQIITDGDASIAEQLIEEQKAENIRDYLRELSRKPHLAGTPEDLATAETLRDFWKDQGFDTAKLVPYDVLLSYPDPNKPNRVELYDRRDNLIFTSKLEEPILREGVNRSNAVPPFNAFSAPGSPKGDLVYVNFGRLEDFEWLRDNGIDVRGKICIARYGKIFRGSKATTAEQFGAVGLILYTDPANYANNDVTAPYPESWWMPEGGVQRGSLWIDTGDPLTPGYPATESAYRVPEMKTGLPRIPVHPIGYGDAEELLKRLGGPVAPSGWSGNLSLTYRVGPGFSEPNMKVQLKVATQNKRAKTYNVVGMIKGSLEPDRYVVISNHRDAWVYGAVDPSSATAVMMEQSRAMGELLRKGWRPRRSILFCSWGAEEFGIIGSNEWVEQYRLILSERTVGLINMDMAVSGNFTFRGRGMPLAYNLMYDVAKKIPNPDRQEKSRGRQHLYDTWAERYPQKDSDGNKLGKPKIPILGSGSDFAPFVGQVGVTCIDIRYMYDPESWVSSHPLYHTIYETFHLVETYLDPTFEYHLAVSRYGTEFARRLADSLILPFDPRDYAIAIETYVQSFEDIQGRELRSRNMEDGLEFLAKAVQKFKEASREFMERITSVNTKNPLEVRKINDQLLSLERAFINPQGTPGNLFARNVVFGIAAYDSYSGKTFPGLAVTLFDARRATVNSAEKWDKVREQLAILTYFIESASSVLKPEDDF